MTADVYVAVMSSLFHPSSPSGKQAATQAALSFAAAN